MPHPIMFRDDDLGLAEVRNICLGFPEAFEKISWGRPVFCAPKMFVMYGGNAKTDVKGEYISYPYSILVKVDDSDRRALEQDTRFFFPAYMGPFGWLGLDFTARKKVDWDEVRELIDASFRMIAPKKLIKQLDEFDRQSAGHDSIGEFDEFRESLPRSRHSVHRRLRLPVRRHRRRRPRPGGPG